MSVLPLVVDATSPETQSLDEDTMRTILVGTYGEDVTVKDTMEAICTRLEENNQTVPCGTHAPCQLCVRFPWHCLSASPRFGVR